MNNFYQERIPRGNTTLLIFYLLLLVYGTLFPLSNWRPPNPEWLDIAINWQLREVSKSDIITNLFVYVPLGFLLVNRFSQRTKQIAPLILAVFAGSFLSLSLELIQAFLPNRVTSTLDLLLNATGSLLGGGLALLINNKSYGASNNFINKYFLPGTQGHIALTIIVFWLLSHLIPLAPSLDWGLIKEALKPIIITAKQTDLFNYSKSAKYAFYFFCISIIMLISMRDKRTAILAFILICAILFAGKIVIIYRAISLEGIVGCMVAILLSLAIMRTDQNKLKILGVAAILLAITIDQTTPATDTQSHSFSWIPFLAHMQNLNGFINILDTTWPYMALSYFYLLAFPNSTPAGKGLYLVIITIISTSLEINQLYTPGRYPDITDIIIAAIGTLLVFNIACSSNSINTRPKELVRAQ